MVKNNVEVKTNKKSYRVDTLAVKDFYLKIKIANIRKTLNENTSINKELCLDPVTHQKEFNMKTFVRALEDIAEVEQERIYDEEKIMEEKSLEIAAKQIQEREKQLMQEKDETDTATNDNPALGKVKAKSASPSEYADLKKIGTAEGKSEVGRFGKGSGKSRRSPNPPGKF